MKCLDCNGSGATNYGICYACKGVGTVEQVDCSLCRGGGGFFDDVEGQVPCAKCGGSGISIRPTNRRSIMPLVGPSSEILISSVQVPRGMTLMATANVSMTPSLWPASLGPPPWDPPRDPTWDDLRTRQTALVRPAPPVVNDGELKRKVDFGE